jgi:hypothetical protein
MHWQTQIQEYENLDILNDSDPEYENLSYLNNSDPEYENLNYLNDSNRQGVRIFVGNYNYQNNYQNFVLLFRCAWAKRKYMLHINSPHEYGYYDTTRYKCYLNAKVSTEILNTSKSFLQACIHATHTHAHIFTYINMIFLFFFQTQN